MAFRDATFLLLLLGRRLDRAARAARFFSTFAATNHARRCAHQDRCSLFQPQSDRYRADPP